MAGDKNIHRGHFQRLKKEFEAKGFTDWPEHKVLEYILHQVTPRVDTNEKAHHIIDECGGFAQVFRSSKENLTDIVGVGDKTADYLILLGALIKYYNGVRYDVNRITLDSENCKSYLLNLFDGMERENFYIICLDPKSRIILKRRMFEGNFESMEIDVTQIIRIAVKCDASFVLLAHNHPSGIAKASDADIATTLTISRALKLAGITLLDHIVVADGKTVSIREEYPQKY